MRSSSARFKQALRSSHHAIVRVDLIEYQSNDPTSAVVTTELVGVTDGAVALDQTAGIRGKLNLKLVDDGDMGLVPQTARSGLAPYGNELRPWRGIQYPDGVQELISLGIYRIEDVATDDTPTGIEITVTALDRSARIQEARFEAPYQIDEGTNYVTALEALLRQAYPEIEVDFPTTTLLTPLLVGEEGGDRWAFAQDMAAALQSRLYFDGDGVCVLRTISNGVIVNGTLDEGADGILVTAGKGFKREGAYNRVIATGENTAEAAPVRGTATDSDPASPTHYGGPYGKVPMFYSSPFLITNDQATGAAQGMLAKQLGSTQTVDFGTIIDPTLEPDDVMQITRAASYLDEAHIIDTISIPLKIADTDAMAGTTRAITGVLGL